MTRVLTLSVLAAAMTLGLAGTSAQAHERHHCTWVKKCHGPFFHRRCETVKVCPDFRFDHDRDHDRHR